MSFVHLHNHTQYSLLDGASRISDLMRLASEWQMPAIAITDHGNMYGAIDFYKTAKAHHIKPIIGMEGYIINGSILSEKDKQNPRHHITLLTKNQTGYHNLMKLSSIAFIKGHYYKPRIDKNLLTKYSEGLIGLSGCMQGEVSQMLLQKKYDKAVKVVEEYQKIFGKDNFYLEVMRLGLDKEEELIDGLKKLSKETGAPLVATNDCHFIKKIDAKAQDVLLCIQTGKTLEDTNRMKFTTDQIYFRSPNEMKHLFSDIPEAIENTLKVADKCNLELDYEGFLFPNFSLPEGYSDDYEFLRKLVYEGVEKKYDEFTDEIKNRIEHELAVIKDMGFVSYFLIVWDIIKSAREMEVMVGPGRGSCAGSIVAYLIDITKVDPIRYNLFFERFLNPARVSMPDIDTDFSNETRPKVLEYIVKKYGRENVSQIGTLGSLGAKMVIRDVGRAMSIPLYEVDAIAKLIPGGPDVYLKQAYEQNEKLRELINSKDRYKELWEYSKTLEGLPRHSGVHAAGVVIAPDNLTNHIPLAINPKDQTIITQYDGKCLEKLGLLKIDCLGLKNLTIIEKALQLIKKHHDIELNINEINLHDTETYKLFHTAETDGVFQFESSGMRGILKRIKPNSIEDLAICNALYRPGTLDSGMHEVYIRRKNNEEEVDYLDPMLEDILRSTYGVIVFQEQVIQIVHKLAGFTLSEADVLRKAMGKKDKSLMDKYRPLFIEGAVKNGISREKAIEIFERIETFGRYGFNKSHSVAYSIISYQTAYLKTHYTAEFMAALMTVENDTAKIARLIEVCHKMNIEVLHPNVNISDYNFTVKDGKIIFGLKAIKNLGENAIRTIVETRKKHPTFKNIFELCEKVDANQLNKTAMESLIGAGALDDLDGNRAQLYTVVETALEFGSQKMRERQKGQSSLFASMQANDQDLYPLLPDKKEWEFGRRLDLEKDLLGFYISGHPLTSYEKDIQTLTNLNTKQYKKLVKSGKRDELRNQEVRIIGIVDEIKLIKDKKKRTMAFVSCEDLHDKFEVVLFSNEYTKFGDLINEKDIIYVIGKLSSKVRENQERLSVVANQIILEEDWQKDISGIISFEIDEAQYSEKDLKHFVEEQILTHPGNFRVVFNVRTKLFGTLKIESQRYRIYPHKNLYRYLQNNGHFIENMKVNFNEK
ncbi:DNA polymerase III subunit alpha [bacterium]|nr:MAG: DNA polymerase III subunit alpha [bacterium]